jgi:hypothetical protein
LNQPYQFRIESLLVNSRKTGLSGDLCASNV